MRELVVGLRDAIGVERIRLDDVGASSQVLLVDLGDDLRTGQDEQLVIAFQILRGVSKQLAAVVVFREPVTLNTGAHRTVDDEDAVFCELSQSGFEGGPHGAGNLRDPAPADNSPARFFAIWLDTSLFLEKRGDLWQELGMDEQIRAQIQKAIETSEVVLFMKGTRFAPACGFSGKTVELLDSLLDEYDTVDVLSAPELREGIKEFSSWPTLPQLYVRGKFVGGADIISQSFEAGTLDEMLGLPPKPAVLPQISLSEGAAAQFRAYLGDSDEVVSVDIDANFQTGLSIAPLSPNLVVVEVSGIRLAMDRLTAGRADGVSIDFIETPNGGAFKVTNPREPAKVRQLTPSALKGWMDRGEDFALIDVRTLGEWNTARISGARLLDADSLDAFEALPKDKRLVFQCHHGHRSQRAAEQFLNRGFREVFNLVGGIDAWSLEVDPSVPRY